MCETIVLSKKASAVISYCKCCSVIYIWHHNLMLSFEYDQFEAFRNFTEEVDYEELTYPFPDGTERIILRTPNRDINFTFSVDEWHSFRQAMDEALYMREVYMLIDK